MIGPGARIDETAHLKHGDATAYVEPQRAGITGQVENCVTAVFSVYVTTSGRPGRTSTCTCRTGGRRTRNGAGEPGSRATW